jgi:tetratricopeptide (TPR) repeat protein
MNRLHQLTRFVAAAIFIAAVAAVAAAQTVTFGGKVFLKQADGSKTPLPGAIIKIYRTDIKQEFETKSDKNGRYIHAGLPYVGTYTVVVSGPGARPQYFTKIKASALPPEKLASYEITMEPGDGSTLTLDQVKTFEAAGGSAAPATAAAPSAEDKKKAAELLAERKRIDEQNAKATAINAKAPELLKAGNEAFGAKRWDDAIAQYDQGIALVPDEPVFYRNKASALFSRGRDKYNAAVKAKPNDQAGINGAREDMKAATEAAEKAVEAQRKSSSTTTAGGATAGTQPNKELDLLSTRAEAYRLALTTNTQVDNDAAAKAIQEYIDAEPDQAKKDATQASLGDALRFAGKYDESIAKFREILAKNPNNLEAIFGLGIALASKSGTGDTNPALVTEARDALKQYVSKAPETNPRKQEAAGMVAYLDDTLKGMAASKEAESKPKTPVRRKP